MKTSKVVLAFSLILGAALPLCATETAFWQVGTFDELLQGTLQGVSLTKDGELKLAPDARAVYSPDETMALSIVADHSRNLYLGTGQQGKVFRVGPDGKGKLFFTTQEPQVFALALGPDGALYVGSSPEGKIYRVTSDGQSKVFFDPKAKYIWALSFDGKGQLYAGTGDRGLIYRIDPSGKGAVFFDSKQTHIMCLAQDPSGNLIAGSVPNGLVYRITSQGKAFVIYQASLPEIHDLATDSKGRIYAAALGGPGGAGTPGMWGPTTTPPVTAPTTTVTVEASADETKTKSNKPQSGPPAATTVTPNFSHPTPMPGGFPATAVGQGRGSLIQISPDNSTETLWTSNNESIFGLAVRNGKVLFSTDSNGRIFELTPSRDSQDLTLLTETHESLATRLMFEGSDLYATTSNIAKLVEVSSQPAHEGTYLSPVKDTKFVSRWGVLAWRGEVPGGTSIEFFSRSGNSDRPDETWSDWAGPYHDSNGTAIQNPPARYIQWKAVFHTSGTASPSLDDATVSYLNQNLAPVIRSLNVSTAGERTGPGVSSFSSTAPGATVTVSPTSVSYGPTASVSGGVKTPTTLSWQAEDPNGDQLVYSLFVKSEDEEEWHLVKDKMHQISYTLDPQALPDGKYVARLVASDEESNPLSTARKSELLSAPFWIDNTPPEVKVLKQTVTGGEAEIQFHVEDATSPLRAAESATDSTDWHDLYSDDGVVDSQVETFTVRVHNLGPGEHIVALRAYDTAGNVGVGKAVIRITAGSRPVQ